ncbi:MAG: DoxX family protein [Egibacteraceae bacterium]
MNVLALAPLGRLAGAAPVVVRVIVGVIMLAHGWSKLTGPGGPAGFGTGALARLGVPAPVLFGYLVTFGEIAGGLALIVGLLTRLAAVLLTVNLVLAILLVKIHVGLIAPQGPGAELDLALIAGFVAVALLGPGRPSLDHALGLERGPAPRPT